jgi:flagellar motor switch/type III secretory pathway protein FliN
MEPNRTEIPVDRVPGEEAAWTHVKGLLCRLSVEVPIPHFTVRQLLDLAPGVVLDTHYEEGSHLPVIVNGQMIAWGEFDVADEILAIRLTELVS